MNVTPSPVRKVKHVSKQGKARLDCTYSTGTEGLNLQKTVRETQNTREN